MPPAFNLSQDQTLQFDLSRFHHSLDSTPPRPLDEKRNGNTVGNLPVTNRTSVVRVLSTSGKPPKLARHKRRRPEAPASAPTPIDCQLLKSALYRRDESGRTAAKRRDYRMRRRDRSSAR